MKREERKAKKVLVIDDDGMATDLIATTLLQRGYEVTVAATAEEGVAAARDSMPDLIFLSLLLPGSNGLKVGKALHGMQGLERVPMVMLISYAGELDPKYMTTIGVVGVLVKPLDAADVIGAAQRILGPAPSAGVMEEIAPVEEGEEVEPLADEGLGEDRLAETGVRFSGRPDRVSEEREWADMQEDSVAGAGEDKEYYTYELEAGDREPSVDRPPQDEAAPDEQYGGATEVFAGEEAQSGSDRMRKVLKGVAAAAVICGAVIGGLQVKKHFFPAVKGPVQRAPEPAKPQQVPVEIKDNMPEVGKKGPSGPGKESAGAPVDMAPEQEPAKARPQTQEKKAAAVERPHKTEKAPAAAKPGISVQVGVFVDERNAAALAEQLKNKGFDAFVLKDEGARMKGGKVAHRVLVGRFDDRKRAAVQATALEKEGIKSIIFSPAK